MDETSDGRHRGDWNVSGVLAPERIAASVAFAREPDDPFSRGLSFVVPSRPALVLGSAQSESLIDADGIARRGHDIVDAGEDATDGVEIVKRRTGGGAVFLVPDNCLWVDVVIPRADPLWVDDVSYSFRWLGETWERALFELGFDARVNTEPRQRTEWGDLICFAALGAGEVTIEAQKVVGLSQRRTREAAKFQCVLYTGPSLSPDVVNVVDLLTQPTGLDERIALSAHLRGFVASVPVLVPELIRSFVDALPA